MINFFLLASTKEYFPSGSGRPAVAPLPKEGWSSSDFLTDFFPFSSLSRVALSISLALVQLHGCHLLPQPVEHQLGGVHGPLRTRSGSRGGTHRAA